MCYATIRVRIPYSLDSYPTDHGYEYSDHLDLLYQVAGLQLSTSALGDPQAMAYSIKLFLE